MEDFIEEPVMIEFKDGEWVGGVAPQDNESYFEVVAGAIVIRKYSTYVEPTPDLFTTNNEAVTVNGFATQAFNTFYSGSEGDTITMSFDVVNDQAVLQTQLDGVSLGYPPLMLPVTRYSGKKATDDEIYLATTLVNGVITVSGRFKNSGNWKLVTDRINESLEAIGADWAIEKPTVTFGITA